MKRTAPRVLIVDDEREILTLCEAALAPYASVTSLTRGEDAFQAAATLQPDVVVLDLAMPGVDGWHVCRELRANVHTARIPVIVLTGHDSDEVTATAIRYGVRAVLTKPCSVDRLVASMLAAVEISQRRRDQDLLERYYELFNERRFVDAQRLVTYDASLPDPAGAREVGFASCLTSMNHWCRAFPDAQLTVLRIDSLDAGYRVDLLVEGTHHGDFEIKPFGWFHASGRKITLRLHHYVEIHHAQIARSFVSFDPQDLGRQLAERAS
jgi:DNA-binding response OmpR family regulator